MSDLADAVSATVGIVGAGPIGLELAVALKRAGIDYLQFDAQQIGYTISWFPPQTRFFSSNERIAIAGVPLHTPDQGKCTREQYLAYLRGVVEQFDLKVHAYEPVVGIERLDDVQRSGFLLTTRPAGGAGRERRFRVGRLVLATGGADHPRRLNIPGEDLPHVSHYFGDPHRYFRQRVMVVGGKNSAVEAALRCNAAGAEVSISYRRPELPTKSIKYWLMPEIAGLLSTGRIQGHFSTVPVSIAPGTVTLANITDGGARTHRAVPADFVLLLTGYEQDNTLLKLTGTELHGDCGAPVFDPRTMETTVPGLYVAGTSIGGTQNKYTVFIENCHVHAQRITAALTGAAPPPAPAPLAQPES